MTAAGTDDIGGGIAGALPPFFKAVSALDAGRHGGLKLDRADGFGFAAGANALPLGLSEITIAAQHYPIVLTEGPHPVPVAILGYRSEENLFVDPAGAWLDDAYVPAYVRAFPFILLEPPGTDTVYLGVETTARMLGERGEPLFEDGKPTRLVADALTFAVAYRDDVKRAGEFGRALADAGLLQPNEARLTFKSGGVARLDGFRVIDPAKLDGLDDQVILEWRRRGWLAPLYTIAPSAARWGRIVTLANDRRQAPA
jgi:hypothetical protein